MKITSVASFALLLVLFSRALVSARGDERFLPCIADGLKNYATYSKIVHAANNSSFKSVLHASIQNLRFASKSTPKPLVIITPEYESQVPHVVNCAKENGLEVRIRSGGHDLEGLSYVSQVPFVILDMKDLSEVSVDVEKKTAWVQSGATLGTLFYKIAEKSPILGFPAGICPSVGVGGHISGGGYGTLMRKYGFAADNVIDAKIVDVHGTILDREAMGEDLFWAIRGGGGASFGVILAWKLQLVDVPEKVTVFTIHKNLEENATQLLHKWQSMAHVVDENLFLRTVIRKSGTGTIIVSFYSLFLGEADSLLSIMQESFPELGLVREDCAEMSWIESVLYFAMFPTESQEEVLLNRVPPFVLSFKVKSDYVQEPISEDGIEGIWKLLNEVETAEIGLSPYGGRMNEISESSIPFPHRAGNLYLIEYIAFWEEETPQNSVKHITWIRKLYDYMTPHVSKSPRAAYMNYRDLDIGVNNENYEQARVWGSKYFKNNFDRLVRVKRTVDPENFFRDEQSIPSINYNTM